MGKEECSVTMRIILYLKRLLHSLTFTISSMAGCYAMGIYRPIYMPSK